MSTPPLTSSPDLAAREYLAVIHAGLVCIASAWLLGGIGETLEWVVAGLGAPALWLLFAEARDRRRRGDHEGVFRLLRWCAPLALLALQIVVSALNPSHRPAFLQDTYILRPVPHLAWLPSSASPLASLRLLACFGTLIATGLCLAFCIQERRLLRRLLIALALNALCLAVLGTIQRHTGATGPYFGALTAPNPAWFATFFYHNHWGAFALLSTATALGLTFQFLARPARHGWRRSPGPLLALSAALIAASIPLSSSRSCTVLVLLLACAAVVVTLRHLLGTDSRRASRRPLPRLFALLAGIVLLGAFVSWQSRDVLTRRLDQTLRQLNPQAALRPDATLYERATHYGRPGLYRDTWRLAASRPAFGWGLDSFGPIFLNHNSIPPELRGQNVFEDAHSDWLQFLAELGFVGTGLLVLVALVPLLECFRPREADPLDRWLLGGCALLAAYAWLEFPFANPAVAGLWWVLFFAAVRHHQLRPSATNASRAFA